MSNDWDVVLSNALASERNIGEEIMLVIEKFTSEEDWTASRAATQTVQYLLNHDPDLLSAFLESHAVDLIRTLISRQAASARSRNRVTARRSVFERAARHFEDTGDDTMLHTNFLAEEYAVSGNRRMRLREMRAEELLFVATRYRTQAVEMQMREAFLRALAARCEDEGRTVGELFSEEELATMWNSITGD